MKIDWVEYFRDFCAKHGEPIQHRNRLLFADAWGYSAKRYEGPEYPPPADEKERQYLKRTYWEIKRRALYDRWWKMNQELQGITELQYIRDVALQQIVVKNENGKMVETTVTVDLDDLKAKVEAQVQLISMIDCILRMASIPDNPTEADTFVEQFGAVATS